MEWKGWWSVECAACTLSYDQATAGGPTSCGACGSRRIKVIQHIVVIDNTKEEANE